MSVATPRAAMPGTGSRMLAALQRVGRGLMLPIAVLPVAALLERFGQQDMLGGYTDADPAGHRGLAHIDGLHWLQHVADVCLAGGEMLFTWLPLLFCVGVAIGFARRSDGSTALSAVVAYLVFHSVSMTLFAGSRIREEVLADDGRLDLGSRNPTYVLGGIVVGIAVAVLWQRFHRIRLPSYLAFFGGRRFVPIISGVAGLLLGVAFSLFWPWIEDNVFNPFGNWMSGHGTVGSGLYGFFNRLLIPLGLHHVLNTIVWYTVPTHTVGGTACTGDMNCYFAGYDGAGTFMTGFFPVMMFGLVGAALAMTREARPERRKLIAGIMFSAALTSFLTGVTEPIEFAFIFVAPVLFLIHAALTGLSLALMSLLGAKLGFGFSGGFIDMALNWTKANTHRPWIVLVVGVGYFFVYYFLFRFAIRRWNLRTPGREVEDDATVEAQTSGQGPVPSPRERDAAAADPPPPAPDASPARSP